MTRMLQYWHLARVTLAANLAGQLHSRAASPAGQSLPAVQAAASPAEDFQAADAVLHADLSNLN